MGAENLNHFNRSYNTVINDVKSLSCSMFIPAKKVDMGKVLRTFKNKQQKKFKRK